jgi:Raf kinase inhibitor-like YbhB/YbcL family protein
MKARFNLGAALLTLCAFGITAQAAQPGGGAGGPPRGGGGGLVPMLVESNAFPDGGIAPLKFSFYGSNTQPDFKISNLPDSAQTIAIIMHDLDVAMGGNTDDVLHWVAYNIPVTKPVTQIEEGKLPEGSAQGRGIRGNGYMGMGAPNGPRYHHYVFEFYALNAKLDLPETAGRPELLAAMQGKVVGKAAYVARFRNDTNATPPGGAGGPPRGGPGAGGPPRGPGAGGPPRGPGAGAPGAGAPPSRPAQ